MEVRVLFPALSEWKTDFTVVGANPGNIWRIPAYLSYLQPQLTDDMVAEAELEIGFALPKEYLNCLKVQNGGFIRYSLPDCVQEMIVGIGPHTPSINRFSWQDYDYDGFVSFELNGLVPFDGIGQCFLCLDYRRNIDTPAVTYVDTESDYDSRVASSFAAYLSLLVLDVDDGEFVMPFVSDIQAVLSRLSDQIGFKFSPADSSANGYPVYHMRYGRRRIYHLLSSRRRIPQGIWISPNVVPRGFVMPDDPRFNELRNLMPGEAPRFPELPESSYILATTHGVRDQLLDACKQLAIEIRPLREYVK